MYDKKGLCVSKITVYIKNKIVQYKKMLAMSKNVVGYKLVIQHYTCRSFTAP